LQTTFVGNSVVLLSGMRREMVMDLAGQTAAEMYRRMFRSRSFELAAIG
jgi:hypothetical protein